MPGIDSSSFANPLAQLNLADFRAAAEGASGNTVLLHQNGVLRAVTALEPPGWGTQVVAWLHEKLEIVDSQARATVVEYDAQRQNAREVMGSFERALQQRFGSVTQNAPQDLRAAIALESSSRQRHVTTMDRDALTADAVRSALGSDAFKTLESRLDKVQQDILNANQARMEQFLQGTGVGSARPLKDAVAAFGHLEHRQADVQRDAMAVHRAIRQSHFSGKPSPLANQPLRVEEELSSQVYDDLGTSPRSAGERNRTRAQEASSPFAEEARNSRNPRNPVHVANPPRISESQARDDLMASLCRALFERMCTQAPENRNGSLNTDFMQAIFKQAEALANSAFDLPDPVRLITQWSGQVPAGTAKGFKALIGKALEPPAADLSPAAPARSGASVQSGSARHVPQAPEGHREANLDQLYRDVYGLKSFEDLLKQIKEAPSITRDDYKEFVRDIQRMSAHPSQADLFAALQAKTSSDIWMSGERNERHAALQFSVADHVVSMATGLPLGSIPSMGVALARFEVALMRQGDAPNNSNLRAATDQSIEDVKFAVVNALLPEALNSPPNSSGLVFGADAPSENDRVKNELDRLLDRVHELVDDLEPQGVVALVRRLVSDARYADRQASFNTFLQVYSNGRGLEEDARAQARQRYLTALQESPAARAPQPAMRPDAVPTATRSTLASPMPAPTAAGSAPAQVLRQERPDEKASEPRPQRHAAPTFNAGEVLSRRLQAEGTLSIRQSLERRLEANTVLNQLGFQLKSVPGQGDCGYYTLMDQLVGRQVFELDRLLVPRAPASRAEVASYRANLQSNFTDLITPPPEGGDRGGFEARMSYVGGEHWEVLNDDLRGMRDRMTTQTETAHAEMEHFRLASLVSQRPLIVFNFNVDPRLIQLADPKSREANYVNFDDQAVDVIRRFLEQRSGVPPIFAINSGGHWDSVEPLPAQFVPLPAADRGTMSSALSTRALFEDIFVQFSNGGLPGSTQQVGQQWQIAGVKPEALDLRVQILNFLKDNVPPNAPGVNLDALHDLFEQMRGQGSAGR